MSPVSLNLNKEHVWGSYYELRINPVCIQRTVFLDEGGQNSLHRHKTEEWMTVIEGAVEFTIGLSEDCLDVRVLKPGDALYVPSLHWHRIRYVSGEQMVDGTRCAIINETMLGEHLDGKYLIERLQQAVPSLRHRRK